MTVAVLHGSPRKGNTYKATKIFMDGLSTVGDVRYTEFFLPEAMPELCTGCQLCHSGPHEKCPHARCVAPILDAILTADALVVTTPHYGASSMSSCMKNLLDHLDFLVMTVAPRPELFRKKAFILTTGAGSAAAVKPISKYLKNWGVNRVYALGIRMFTNAWASMPEAKRGRCENKLRRAARGFYHAPQGRPYLWTIVMYYVFRFIIKKYVGEGAYPYEYWRAMGFFDKRPF